MRRRLFLFALTLTAVVFAAVCVLFGFVFSNGVKERTQQSLAENCTSISVGMSIMDDDSAIEYLKKVGDHSEFRVTLVNSDGQVLFDSEAELPLENHGSRPEVVEARDQGEGTSIRYSETLQSDVMYKSLLLDNGNVLRLSLRLSTVWDYVAELMGGIVWIIIIMLVLITIIAWLLAGKMNQPIVEMTYSSRAIANGRYDLRICSMIGANDELGELSRSFNTMADRLEHLVQDLNQENEKLNAILDAMSNGILAVDTNMHITLRNQRIMNIMGISEDPMGKHILEVTRLETLESLAKRVVETGKTVSDEMLIGNIWERRRLIKVYIIPMRREGKISGAVIRAEDVQAMRALEQMRSDFAANVSHELKTPLTSIRGFIETLQNGAIEDKDKAHRFLGIISVEAERLNRLIEDILMLSNIESGNIPAFTVINLEKMVEDTLDFVQATAANKKIKLSWENITGDALHVKGNKDWIKQMMINLADNAIKYTQSGGEVNVILDADKDFVTIYVKDSGIGISKDDLNRVFERFYRADKSRSNALGSTGLGLAIVKHIVEQMGGSLELESELGKGTTFKIKLAREDCKTN